MNSLYTGFSSSVICTAYTAWRVTIKSVTLLHRLVEQNLVSSIPPFTFRSSLYSPSSGIYFPMHQFDIYFVHHALWGHSHNDNARFYTICFTTDNMLTICRSIMRVYEGGFSGSTL